jgi:hypothetical protein
MPMWITWRHAADSFPQPWTLDNKIEIFYERFYGWQLNIANTIANGAIDTQTGKRLEAIPHSDFATLSVCMSYFEMIGKYEAGYTGERKSLKHFGNGLKSVFSEIASWRDEQQKKFIVGLYHRVRCGFYHVPMTGPKEGVESGNYCIAINDNEDIFINPHRLPVRLLKHLGEYRDRLLHASQAKLRTNFERRFDKDNGISA